MAIAYVQFPTDSTKNRSGNRTIAIPKRVTEIYAWFRECRKVLPQIPDPEKGEWVFRHMEASVDEIRFLLEDRVGQQCVVKIDRTRKFST